MEASGAGHHLLRRSIRTRNITRTSINHGGQSNWESNDIIENIGDADNTVDIQKNPLQNPLIINHVFSFLDLNDIKQCGLVCKKWNDLSISFIDKNSAIKIGYPEKPKIYAFQEMSPNSFKEFWKDSERIFRAFKLAPFLYHEAKWPVKALVGFLKDQSHIMQELTINNIKIIGYDGKSDRHYNPNYFAITPYINDDLTQLDIDNTNGSKFILSIKKLTSAKRLSLTRCALNVIEKCKLSPEKFEMNYVGIVKHGEMTTTNGVVLANELIDFKNLKELTLKCPTCAGICCRSYGSQLAVDMSGKTSLDMLHLNSVKIHNFKESQWQINGKLTLRSIPYIEETQIKFTELDFGNDTINLDALPASIEKLTLMLKNDEYDFWARYTDIIGSPLLTLPNLKYLEILTDISEVEDEIEGEVEEEVENEVEDEVEYENDDDESTGSLASLALFTGCGNLTTVNLFSDTLDFGKLMYQDINSDWIPPSTKNLFLTGNFRAKVGEEVKLEKLVIQDNNLDNIIETVNRLKSNHLVLDLNSEFLKWNKNLDQIILALIEMPYDSLAIGSLDITEAAFRKSSFSKCVDQQAEYYVFRNQKGKSIMEWEFIRMTKPE